MIDPIGSSEIDILIATAWHVLAEQPMRLPAKDVLRLAAEIERQKRINKPAFVALKRIEARLRGDWHDPQGDLESDIAGVIRAARAAIKTATKG